jgi:tRNA threonylcarbamoyladenosine biosynthesis protein TsaB
MRLLALETSTELGSCALWIDGQITEKLCPVGRSHSETLLPLVRELLNDAGLRVADLDAIAFGAGPGAFTGLRVACGAAQGLAVAADLPLVQVTSLETLAMASGQEKVISLLDARMGEVYAATYQRGENCYGLAGEIRVVAPLAVPVPEDGGWLACGNAPAAYPELAARLAVAGITVLPDILPLAADVARLAVARFRRGDYIDPALAAPLYIRDKVAKTVAERLGEGGKA